MNTYKARVIFESNICPGNGFSYLVIYGRHVNGYFCAIPNLSIACEMTNPEDVLYNSIKLGAVMPKKCGGVEIAQEIAKQIELICKTVGYEHDPYEGLPPELKKQFVKIEG